MTRNTFSPITLFICVVFPIFILGQVKPVNLIESSFIVRNRSSEHFYFGLAAGDRLTFKITTSSLKQIRFEEYNYNGGPLFELSNPDSIINHTIEIEHDGIYYFSFEQSGFLAGRSFCSLTATRIPVSKETEKFNSTVYWKSQTDTIKYKETEKYIEKVDTIVTHIVNQSIELKGKANSSSVLFFLPDNSTSWSYFIATGKDAEKVFTDAEKQFTTSSPIIKKHGLMAGIAINGIASFAINPKCREVKYIFTYDNDIVKNETIDSLNSISDFKITYLDFKKVNDSIRKPTRLFIQNNSKKKINVFIRITSVEIIDRWAIREIDKIRIETKDVPYLKN